MSLSNVVKLEPSSSAHPAVQACDGLANAAINLQSVVGVIALVDMPPEERARIHATLIGAAQFIAEASRVLEHRFAADPGRPVQPARACEVAGAVEIVPGHLPTDVRMGSVPAREG